MEWLGVNLNQSLSNIKGQITNFTKEVLVDDEAESLNDGDEHEGLELSLCSRKDLESIVLHYKMKVDESKRHELTLEDRLRVVELESNQKTSVLQQELNFAKKELDVHRGKSNDWSWEAPSESKVDQASSASNDAQKWKEQLQQRLVEQREMHQAEIATLQEAHKLQIQQLKHLQHPGSPDDHTAASNEEAHPGLENTAAAASAARSEEDEQRISQLNQLLASLQTQLERTENENASLKSSLEQLDHQHNVIVEQILSKKNALKDELDEAKNFLNKVKEENDLYNESIECKTTELQKLQAHFDQMQNEKEDRINELQELIDKISNEKNEICLGCLEKQNDLSKLKTLQQSLEEQDSLRRELHLSIDQLTKSLSDTQEENNQLKSSLENKVDELEKEKERTSSNKNLEEQISILKSENSKLMDKTEESRRKISDLNDTLTFKEEEILKHEAIFEEKCSEHTDMYDRLMSMRCNFEKREQEFKQEKKSLENSISLLEDSKDSTASSQSSPHSEIISQLMQSSDAQNAIDLPTMWTELASEVAALRCERDRVHESMSSTELELRTAQDLLEALEIEKSDAERECEDLRDQLEELQCGERQPPEGSLTPVRSLPTIEEESELSPVSSHDEVIQDENRNKELPFEANSTRGINEKDPQSTTSSSTIEAMEDELNKYKGLIIYKDDQLDQIKLGIDQIKEIFGLRQTDDLRQTYISIRQEYTSLLSKLDAKENELSEFKKLNSDLEISNNVSKFEKDELERKATFQLVEKNSILEAKKSQLAKIQSENVGLNENLTMLLSERNKHADVELKYNKVISENVNKEEEIKSLKAAKQELSKKLESHLDENTNLTARIEEITSEHKYSLERLTAEKGERIAQLEEALNLKAKDSSTKDSTLEDLHLRLEKLSLASSEGEKLNTLLESSSKEKTALESEIKTTKSECQRLQEEMSGLLVSLKASNEDLEVTKKELEKLKEDHHNGSAEISNLQSERNQMIATSQQKHQEALAYYAEIQRLSKLLEQEKHQWTQQESNLRATCSELQEKLGKVSKISKDQEEVSKLQMKHLQQERTKENSSLEQLKDELAKATQNLQLLQKERDQLWKANSSFNEQYEDARKELASSQEKERIAVQECSRLREHLKTIEETTTQEAILAEQKESSLRQTIAKLHEKMASHSNIYTNANYKNAAQVEGLQEELNEAIHQRDEVKSRLSVVEESCLQYQESLARLQQVLSDFQKTQGREISQATEREKRKLEIEVQRNENLKKELSQVKNQLSEMQANVFSSESLQREMLTKDDTIVALKSQVYSVQQAAKKTQERVVALQSSSDSKVDKPLLRNLFVGYFATTSDKRKEVLHIIAQVLDLSSDERHRIGLDAHPGSWLASIANFLAPPPSNVRVTSKVDLLDHTSLSQAFIRFLEEETSPLPQARLPAVEMAEKATLKTERKLQAAAKLSQREGESPSPSNTSPPPSLLDANLALPLPTLHPINEAGGASKPEEEQQLQASTTPQTPPTPASHFLSSLLSTKELQDANTKS